MRYFYSIEGTEYGPTDWNTILEYQSQGMLNERSPIREEGGESTVPLMVLLKEEVKNEETSKEDALFYCKENNIERGPFEWESLMDKILEGEISWSTPVRKEDSSNFTPLHKWKETSILPHDSGTGALGATIGLSITAAGIAAAIIYLAPSIGMVLAVSGVFFFICYKTAESKNIGKVSYGWLGALTWIIGLIIVLAIPSRR